MSSVGEGVGLHIGIGSLGATNGVYTGAVGVCSMGAVIIVGCVGKTYIALDMTYTSVGYT